MRHCRRRRRGDGRRCFRGLARRLGVTRVSPARSAGGRACGFRVCPRAPGSAPSSVCSPALRAPTPTPCGRAGSRVRLRGGRARTRAAAFRSPFGGYTEPPSLRGRRASARAPAGPLRRGSSDRRVPPGGRIRPPGARGSVGSGGRGSTRSGRGLRPPGVPRGPRPGAPRRRRAGAGGALPANRGGESRPRGAPRTTSLAAPQGPAGFGLGPTSAKR